MPIESSAMVKSRFDISAMQIRDQGFFRRNIFRFNLGSKPETADLPLPVVQKLAIPSSQRTKKKLKALPEQHQFSFAPSPSIAADLIAFPLDTTAKYMSAFGQAVQQDSRRLALNRINSKADLRSRIQNFEFTTDLAALQNDARLEGMDHASLRNLEKATANFVRQTPCTPPFEPTLWSKPSRRTASSGSDGFENDHLSHWMLKDSRDGLPVPREDSPFFSDNGEDSVDSMWRSEASVYAHASPARQQQSPPTSRNESRPSLDRDVLTLTSSNDSLAHGYEESSSRAETHPDDDVPSHHVNPDTRQADAREHAPRPRLFNTAVAWTSGPSSRQIHSQLPTHFEDLIKVAWSSESEELDSLEDEGGWVDVAPEYYPRATPP